MFEPGRSYRREHLHHVWDGTTPLQAQGGILTPREVPLVVVITGEAGGQYGYADFWDADGVFHYFGAGQVGDMEFVRGNLALRDHSMNGEELHLFEQDLNRLRYVGPKVCAGFYERDDAPDRNGDLRRAIVFELVSLDATLTPAATDDELSAVTSDRRWEMPLEALRERLAEKVGNQPNAKEAKRRTYARSNDLKAYVCRRAAGVCEGCGSPAPFTTKAGFPYLEPHHSRRIADGGPDDYHHVIALCPTCHRRVHYAVDGDEYNEQLSTKLREIEG